MLYRHFEGSLSITGRINPKALALKVHAGKSNDRWLVIDEEDQFVGHFWLIANGSSLLVAAGGI